MKVGLILISLLVCLALLTGPYIRWGIVAFYIFLMIKNEQQTTRVVVGCQYVKEIVICLINNKEVSFDKLVKDLFSELDDSLDNEDRAS